MEENITYFIPTTKILFPDFIKILTLTIVELEPSKYHPNRNNYTFDDTLYQNVKFFFFFIKFLIFFLFNFLLF